MPTPEPDLSRHRPTDAAASPATAGGLVVPVVTRAGREPDTTGQSGGATRISGVSIQHTPATRLWFGKVHNDPGYRSVPHHHGAAETGGYVLSGRARIYFGPQFADYLDMSEGDWVFVPPHLPHVECNLDRNRPLTWMTTRTPDNIVVNLADVPDDDLRDWVNRA
ncbi:MAG TPA: cupin domain-containing protein [Pseudonocardia sp.]